MQRFDPSQLGTELFGIELIPLFLVEEHHPSEVPQFLGVLESLCKTPQLVPGAFLFTGRCEFSQEKGNGFGQIGYKRQKG